MDAALSLEFEDPRTGGVRRSVTVRTYWAALDVDAAEEARFAALLIPDELERASLYRSPDDRRAFVVRRGRLRELLADRLGCPPQQAPLSFTRFGKPFVEGADLSFNLSSSGGLAFYVFADGTDVGCDIEWRRPRLATMAVAEHTFSKGEVERLASVPPSRRIEAFFNCWTRKEAFIKAVGLGVSYPLKDFDVSLAPGEPGALLRGPPGWSLRSFAPRPDLHAAIAIHTGAAASIPSHSRCINASGQEGLSGESDDPVHPN